MYITISPRWTKEYRAKYFEELLYQAKAGRPECKESNVSAVNNIEYEMEQKLATPPIKMKEMGKVKNNLKRVKSTAQTTYQMMP